MTASGNGTAPPGAIHPDVVARNESEKAEMHRWKVDIEDRLKRLEAQVETIRLRRERGGDQWP